MTQLLDLGRDQQGNTSYAPIPSMTIYNAVLQNDTETHIIVPSTFTKWVCSIGRQDGLNVWADFSGATAVAPTGSSLGTATAVLNPAARTILSGSQISLITDNGPGGVSIELYGIA